MSPSARAGLAEPALDQGALRHFPIGLPELLERRALLRRTDTKFVLPQAELEPLLAPLHAHYAIIPNPRALWSRYESLYFDTLGLACYHAHRRGQRPRYKVRIRHYPDRQVSFLEVKRSSGLGNTVKHRQPKAYAENELDAADREFIGRVSSLDPHGLEPQLWTYFTRLTLVGISSSERVTLDVGVRFVRGALTYELAPLAIIEVKQWPFRPRTPIMLALRSRRVREIGGSKYCTATALTRADVPRNRFLATLRALGKGGTSP